MYDPTVGEFLSEDPIGFAGQDSNLRRYVHNGPLNHTDPSGLQQLTSAAAAEPAPKWHIWWPPSWPIFPWNWPDETKNNAGDVVVTTIGTQTPAGESEAAGALACVGEAMQSENQENYCLMMRDRYIDKEGCPEWNYWNNKAERIHKMREIAAKQRCPSNK